MPDQNRIVSPGPEERSVRTPTGEILRPPPDWLLLPPGDATLTRRVKAATSTWTVQEKRGRKTFSRGVWAAGSVVLQIQGDLARERTTLAYAKQRAADQQRRLRQQGCYVEDFRRAVLAYLAFDSSHDDLARRLAEAVTQHATPVGSGTVARTKRIPIEQRAEAAVIAWLRHQTTAYDDMAIPRIRGKRRAVRRMLAARSKQLLDAYRLGRPVDADCPLQQAFKEREE